MLIVSIIFSFLPSHLNISQIVLLRYCKSDFLSVYGVELAIQKKPENVHQLQ